MLSKSAITNLILAAIISCGITISNAQTCDKLGSNDIQLMQLLKSAKRTQDEAPCIVYAIEKLGIHENKQAVDILINYLDYRRSETNSQISLHLPTISYLFPSVGSLLSIGKISIPALLNIIGKDDSTTQSRDNAVYTVMNIYRVDPSQAIRLFKVASAQAATPAPRERYKKAAESAVQLCITKRAECEAALKDD